VGVDSGPLHIASALGIPVLALFPTKYVKPSRWGPWGSRHLLLRESETCPLLCFPRTCPESICVDAIAPAQVVQGVEKLLSGSGYVLPAARDYWFARGTVVLFILGTFWPEGMDSLLASLVNLRVHCLVYYTGSKALPAQVQGLQVITAWPGWRALGRFMLSHNVSVIHDARPPEFRSSLAAPCFRLLGLLCALKLPLPPLFANNGELPGDGTALLRQYQAAFARRIY
jgi:hypothetical protein